jgi:hypothetical protein
MILPHDANLRRMEFSERTVTLWSFRQVRSTRHGFREDTEVIDFFAPPRDDFLLGGRPAYMSEG